MEDSHTASALESELTYTPTETTTKEPGSIIHEIARESAYLEIVEHMLGHGMATKWKAEALGSTLMET